jgi:hypothetical protein
MFGGGGIAGSVGGGVAAHEGEDLFLLDFFVGAAGASAVGRVAARVGAGVAGRCVVGVLDVVAAVR